MGPKPIPAPDTDDTMTWPSEGYAEYPDGRRLRMYQETNGARPEFWLYDAGEETGRQVTGDELADLLDEAHQLPPDPA